MSSSVRKRLFSAQGVADETEGLAGDVALENSQGVVSAVACGLSASGEVPCPRVVDHPVVRDRPEGVVGGPAEVLGAICTPASFKTVQTGSTPNRLRCWSMYSRPAPR